MKTQYGFPVVDAQNIYLVLEELGVKAWNTIEGPIPLENYLIRPLDSAQQKELRFVPKSEVVVLEDPAGRLFTGFRRIGKDGAGVFVILPGDLIVIAAEWKHGAEEISLLPPGGLFNRRNQDPISLAEKEFKEETGIELEEVINLVKDGVPNNARNSTERYYPCLGFVRKPLVIGPQKLEKSEFLKIILITVEEWLKLIDQGRVRDAHSIICTYFALQRLGRLHLS